MAFVFSFNDWGEGGFQFFVGIRNLFNALLIALLALLVHASMQRIAALYIGFKAEYRNWLYGLIFSIVLAIVSRGELLFLAPGGMIAYHMAGHRLGAFRYGINYWGMSLCAMIGSLANLALAVLFKVLLSLAPTNLLLKQAFIFNLLLAVFTMLPIPPLNGSHLFFVSRLTYAFSFTSIVAMAALLYFFGIFIALFVGLLIGVVCWQAYYWIFEAT